MSWANFQEERWKIDQGGLEERLGELDGELLSTDAQSSSARQASDIESLISRGVDVLMIVAWDADAILPSVQRAVDEGIPVIAYERQIEHPDVFYTAFNPVDVGRMQAEAVVAARPEGRYAIIAGSPQDQYAHYVLEGQRAVLDPLVEAGDIEIVAEQWTDAWLPDNAQANMEQILTAEGDEIDAVVAANDGTAGGVVAALASVGLDGEVPVSGQDGDIAALNRIALGTQTMTAWKDARELGRAAADVAAEIAAGTSFEEIDGVETWDRRAERGRAAAGLGHGRQPRACRRGGLDLDRRALRGRERCGRAGPLRHELSANGGPSGSGRHASGASVVDGHRPPTRHRPFPDQPAAAPGSSTVPATYWSRSTIAPVIIAASFEIRKATSPAGSSGISNRPNG